MKGKKMKAKRDYRALLQQGIGSLEAKALVEELRKQYPHTVLAVEQVRKTLDTELGTQTLTEMLYAAREE